MVSHHLTITIISKENGNCNKKTQLFIRKRKLNFWKSVCATFKIAYYLKKSEVLKVDVLTSEFTYYFPNQRGPNFFKILSYCCKV